MVNLKRIEAMFWGPSQQELVDDLKDEILRLRSTVAKLEARLDEVETSEFTDYQIKWEGEITFKVMSRNGIEGIEWIDEVLNVFCTDNDATYKTYGHTITEDYHVR